MRAIEEAMCQSEKYLHTYQRYSNLPIDFQLNNVYNKVQNLSIQYMLSHINR